MYKDKESERILKEMEINKFRELLEKNMITDKEYKEIEEGLSKES